MKQENDTGIEKVKQKGLRGFVSKSSHEIEGK